MIERRQFLQVAFGAAFAVARSPAQERPLRGIYPIMQTPFLDSGELDYEALAAETRFLDKTGVHGMVWPQLASEYSRLTFEERLHGAETIVEAGKGLRPKIVIGVQAEDAAGAVQYAKHADKLGPDALIALPPRKGNETEFDLAQVADYYQAIGKASGLPLFVQAIGNISVEFIFDLMRKVPTLGYVKDEAGHTLSRIGEFRQAPRGLRSPGVFTGAHGRTLIDEMALGSAGNMPAASWADLYADCWDHWHAGRESEAIDAFSKVMLFVTQTGAYGLASLHYVLHLRGVFPNWKVRNPDQRPLDEPAREALRRTFEFVKPHLRV